MATTRYIGSKARLASRILDEIGSPPGDTAVFFDGFSGTGVVAREAAQRGWNVRANDYLASSAILTRAALATVDDVPFEWFGGVSGAVDALNRAPSLRGFIYEEYSSDGETGGGTRRYFTPENAMRIDGARIAVEEWRGLNLISDIERIILIASILRAANEVANTAGTYGCYLREWASNALRQIEFRDLPWLQNRQGEVQVLNEDIFSIKPIAADCVYLDPPYTKRQYAAYYHIPETIAFYDAPQVSGKTGLREWKSKSSPFCFRAKALNALVRLLDGIEADRICISYSSEGHIKLDDLESCLSEIGDVTVLAFADIGRYRPNTTAGENGSCVTEFLISVSPYNRGRM
jgi:adenine-specific DNA-methyltransferase